jgi:hypothetical protein
MKHLGLLTIAILGLASSCTARPEAIQSDGLSGPSIGQIATQSPMQSDDIAGRRGVISAITVLDWQAAHATIEYPASWRITASGSDPRTSQRIELLTTKDLGTSEGYFCLDLEINPPSGQSFPLTGGDIIANLKSGLMIYQRDYTDGARVQLQAWLTSQDHLSEVKLENGTVLSAEISYSCVQDDLAKTHLNYEQQRQNSSFNSAVQVLESIRFNSLGPRN